MGKNTSVKKKSSTSKRDPLAPYREQAAPIIRLYFGKDTPDYISDLIADWCNELESKTQVFWNVEAICEVWLPCALKEAARMGIDPFSSGSEFLEDVAETWSERLSFNLDYGKDEDEKTPWDKTKDLRAKLERDADAIAHIMNSPTVPADIKNGLGDPLSDYTDGCIAESPEVLRVSYPLSVLERMRAKEKGTEVQGNKFIGDYDEQTMRPKVIN